MADIIDARVLARRQKDLDGYIDRYQDILTARGEKYAAQLVPIWQRTAQRLDIIVKRMYKEFADGEGKLSEAKLRSLKYGAERLEMLKREIASLLAGNVGKLTDQLKNNLVYQYTHSYYWHGFGLEQAAQVAINVPILTHNEVMGILANPWLPDGATYSDRIRVNTAYLAEKMKQSVGRAMVEGWGWNQTARHIQATAGEGYYNSVRLARTELTRAAAQGANQLFMQNVDIMDGKIWDATLDARTAPKDAYNDGKQYDLDYDTPERPGNPGERIPNHPNCRCRWKPLLSTLGVSKKERIVRGEGDSPQEFGERIYTDARTYEEYAKERGLPPLAERLGNDDPRRYLRQNETMADYKKRVGIVPTDPKIPETKPHKPRAKKEPAPVIASWADRVKARIAQGVATESDVRDVGSLVRQEIEKRVGPELTAVQKRLDELAEKSKLLRAQLDAAREEYVNGGLSKDIREKYYTTKDKINAELSSIYTECGQLSKKLTTLRGETTRDVIGEVRPLGSDQAANIAGRPKKETKEALEAARRFVPKAWLDISDSAPLAVKKVNRGYYQHHAAIPELATSGGTVNSMRDTFLHEMGHRAEYTVPGIRELEKQFYERRTAGETLEWLGSGYGRDERTRRDKFVSAYMGKDYGGRAYELLSMGIEATFLTMERYNITKDEDFYNFILGVITGV